MGSKKLSFYMVAVLVCMLFVSCRDNRLHKALAMSGDNRTELEKVLVHYKGDDLKYKAACFLISNMPGHGRYDSLSVEPLQPYYDRVRAISVWAGWQKTTAWRDSTNAYWEKVKPVALAQLSGMKEDIGHLKSEWLIREIDLAFRAWQENAYSSSISFDDFCRYVLPYRIHNGICADDSRTAFYRNNAGCFADSTGELCMKVDSLLYRYKDLVHNDFAAGSLPLYSFSTFEYLKRGLCDDRCKFNVALLSALGMPVAQDFVPVWGNRSGGHSWNAIVLNGKTYPFEAFWDEDRWKYKRIYNNECFDLAWGAFRLPKVYRYTYEPHLEGPISDSSVRKGDIPLLFHNPFMKDVSSQYFKATDIEVQVTAPIPEGMQYCYLCVFGAKQWHPVQWGKLKANGKVVFKDMGRDIIYLPMFYRNGLLTPAAPAFLLTQDGRCKKALCSEKKMSVTVGSYTSYLYPEEIAEAKKMLLGAYLLGCNELNVGPVDTLACLTDTMDVWQNDIIMNNSKSYRYVRLSVPSDSLGLCEMLFYEQDEGEVPITGVTVSGDLLPLNSFENMEMMADHLSATGFMGRFKKKRGGWNSVCFDLQGAYPLAKISYIPYTKHYLYKDANVDLYYWDNAWVLAGRAKGDGENCITFDDIPEGTFYRAKLEGTNDRIFTYEEGIIGWH